MMTGWSDSSFTSTPITLMTTSSSGFPIGYALVTVFTNGIPSQSLFIDARSDASTQSDPYVNFNTDGNSYSDSDRNSHGYSHTNSYCHSHGDRYADANSYVYTYS